MCSNILVDAKGFVNVVVVVVVVVPEAIGVLLSLLGTVVLNVLKFTSKIVFAVVRASVFILCFVMIAFDIFLKDIDEIAKYSMQNEQQTPWTVESHSTLVQIDFCLFVCLFLKSNLLFFLPFVFCFQFSKGMLE